MLARPTLLALLVTLAACGQRDQMPLTSPLSPSAPSLSQGGQDGEDDAIDESAAGVVFTMNNATSGNAVLVFDRAADGTLTPAGSYATGGAGTGGGLGSQGAVTLSKDGRILLAVNPQSNDVTAFAVRGNRLVKLNTTPSGGLRPISVTISGHLVYVLNAGGSGGIAGFRLHGDDGLTPIAGSARPLSSAAAGPAQISFAPNGGSLIVTEKAANAIVSYNVRADGTTGSPAVTPSAGQTPFGFAFSHRDLLIVSEAFGGAPDASAASSYSIDHGTLAVKSASVPTTETAACWFVVTPNGKFAYTTNTGSGSITGYRVASDGRLSILDADGRTGVTGAGSAPTDEALSGNGRFLFALNSGSHSVVAFRIGGNGSLSTLSGAVGLPVGAVGLAAR